MRAVVLTSTSLGCRAAAHLSALPELESLTLMTAPVSRRPRTVVEKARETWRFDGPPGVLRAAAERLRAPRRAPLSHQLSVRAAALCPGVPHLHVPDFHAPEATRRLAALEPDLGIIVGTYRLEPSFDGVPRLGSINLHFGLAPEYRGSSPAFWELYDGVASVGVTVHWVTPRLDAGDILLQRSVPLDPAPPGDPLDYIARFQQETLFPLGFRLLAEAVRGLALGPVQARPQEPGRGRLRSRATWGDKQELRRRVLARRGAPAAVDRLAPG